MGHTSNAAKQRWNGENYTQLKVWISPDIAAAFKTKCKASNVSMAGELTRFMADGVGQVCVGKGTSLTVTTRPQRRKAVKSMLRELREILEAENEYIDSMPPGIRESARRDAADDTVEALEEALEALCRAY